ncbi:MAG TPA: sprT domain-containing protein, partial [Flavobacteriia bacterium]|nr:sprT domain-containing protein [Flavobacteriia bacterium]
FEHKELQLKISSPRKTKLGDYKRLNRFKHQISINNDLNPYQFLITLLHELAHFLTYKKYGFRIKPHGPEWKSVFGQLLQTYIKPDIFPQEIIPDLQVYAENPKASTAGDGSLYLKLAKYDDKQNENLIYIFELSQGDFFALPNGQAYQLQEKRRTRYKCRRLKNDKVYLIHQNAQVVPLKKK